MISILESQYQLQKVVNLQKATALIACTLLVLGLLNAYSLENTMGHFGMRILCTTGSLLLFANLYVQCMKRKIVPQVDRLDSKIVRDNSMCKTSIFIGEGQLQSSIKPELLKAKEYLSGDLSLSHLENVCSGLLMGGVVADAFFSHLDDLPFKKEGYFKASEKPNMTKDGITGIQTNNPYHLKPGQWSCHSALALCVCDTIIYEHGHLYTNEMMLFFQQYLFYGYNSPSEEHLSIEANPSLLKAIKKFSKEEIGTYRHLVASPNKGHAIQGNCLTMHGPGAIVTNSVGRSSSTSSYVTRLTEFGYDPLSWNTWIASTLTHFLNRPQDENIETYKKRILTDLSMYDSENGNWRNADFNFDAGGVKPLTTEIFPDQNGVSHSSIVRNPNTTAIREVYATALHCISTTNSFEDAVVKAGSRGGNAGLIATLTGQLAGALYGMDAIPKDWVKAVNQWDRNGEIIARALVLMKYRDHRNKTNCLGRNGCSLGCKI